MKTLDILEDKLLLKNLSKRTIVSYISNIKVVSQRIGKNPSDINEEV